MAAAELKLIKNDRDSVPILEALEFFTEMAKTGKVHAILICAIDDRDRSHYRTARGRHGCLSHLVAIAALAARNCLTNWDEAH